MNLLKTLLFPRDNRYKDDAGVVDDVCSQCSPLSINDIDIIKNEISDNIGQIEYIDFMKRALTNIKNQNNLDDFRFGDRHYSGRYLEMLVNSMNIDLSHIDNKIRELEDRNSYLNDILTQIDNTILSANIKLA